MKAQASGVGGAAENRSGAQPEKAVSELEDGKLVRPFGRKWGSKQGSAPIADEPEAARERHVDEAARFTERERELAALLTIERSGVAQRRRFIGDRREVIDDSRVELAE